MKPLLWMLGRKILSGDPHMPDKRCRYQTSALQEPVLVVTRRSKVACRRIESIGTLLKRRLQNLRTRSELDNDLG